VIVSILAVGCLDYFFVEPLFTFQVQSPVDTLGLVSFLVTGLIINAIGGQKFEQKRNHHECNRKDCGCSMAWLRNC